MSEAKHFFHIVRVAPKSDVAVLLTCYFLTVVFDMVIAVTAGMVRGRVPLHCAAWRKWPACSWSRTGHPHLKVKLPKDTVLYEVNGPLFFGAAESAMDAFKAIGARMRVLILNLSAVPAMDITGLVALESTLAPPAPAGRAHLDHRSPPAARERPPQGRRAGGARASAVLRHRRGGGPGRRGARRSRGSGSDRVSGLEA